jgi:hypothetical protein
MTSLSGTVSRRLPTPISTASEFWSSVGSGAWAGWEASDLGEQADVVAAGPVLGDLVVVDPDHVDVLDVDGATGGRDAEELAGVVSSEP